MSDNISVPQAMEISASAITVADAQFTAPSAWIPYALADTAVVVPADALIQRMPGTLRVYAIPHKAHTFTTKGTVKHEMISVTVAVVGLNEYGTPDLFTSDNPDSQDMGPFQGTLPRVIKGKTGKMESMSHQASQAYGPPKVIRLLQEHTFFIFAKNIGPFKVHYDVLMFDVREAVTEGEIGTRATLNDRVTAFMVLKGVRGGLWRQRYMALVLNRARFAPTCHFNGFFHVLQSARQTSERKSNITYFDAPSGILIVFGGSSPNPYHSPQRQATLCEMGGLHPGMVSTGVATAIYAPKSATSKAPIDITFMYNEYSRPMGEEITLQTSQSVCLFKQDDTDEPAWLPGVSFQTLATILGSSNGSFIKALLYVRGKWESTECESDTLMPAVGEECRDLVLAGPVAGQSAAATASTSMAIPQTKGEHMLGCIPRCTANIGTVIDFSDLILSPSSVLLGINSSVVREAMAGKVASTGKDTLNASVLVNMADVHEFKSRVPGTTIAVCPESAQGADLARADGAVFYAYEISGKIFEEGSRAQLAANPPESNQRAGWVRDLMGSNLVVFATYPKAEVRDWMARHPTAGMLPTAQDIPSSLETAFKRQLHKQAASAAKREQAAIEYDKAAAAAARGRSRVRSTSPAPQVGTQAARSRSRSRSSEREP